MGEVTSMISGDGEHATMGGVKTAGGLMLMDDADM